MTLQYRHLEILFEKLYFVLTLKREYLLFMEFRVLFIFNNKYYFFVLNNKRKLYDEIVI